MKTKFFLCGIFFLSGIFFLAGNFLFAQDNSHQVRNHQLYGGISASYAHIFHIVSGSADFPGNGFPGSPYSGKNFSDVQNSSILGGAAFEYFLDEDHDYSLTGRILFQTISNSEIKISSNTPFFNSAINTDTLRNTQMRGVFNYNSLNFEILASRRIFSPLYFSGGLGIMIPTQADYTQFFEITDTSRFTRLPDAEAKFDIRYLDDRTLEITRETKFLLQYYAKLGFQYNFISDAWQLAPHLYYSIGLNDIFTENERVPFVRMNSIIAGIDFRYAL